MEFRLLGPVEVLDGNGEPVDLGGGKKQAKVRCVLASLLYSIGQGVPAAEMNRRLWGDRAPGEMRADQTRQSYVGPLRAALRPHGVRVTKLREGGYWISAERDEVDLCRFQDLYDQGSSAIGVRDFIAAAKLLTQALDLWRGPALADVPGSWADGVRAAYHRRRDRAEQLRFHAEIETGPSPEQIDRFAAWYADATPDDESARLLMTAYCRIGRPDLAEACYASTVERMQVSGREPGQSVRYLWRRIRRRDRELLPPSAAPGGPAAVAPQARESAGAPASGAPASGAPASGAPASGAPASGPALLQIGAPPERADAFQERSMRTDLEARMRDTPGGVSCWILSGLSGVGKTQLAADLARRWGERDQGGVVVWVTASTRQSILNGYAAALPRLGDSVPATVEQDAAGFLEWLGSATRNWLLVLDDLHSPASMSDLWPRPTAAGRVLITTSRRDASLKDERRCAVDVTGFTPREAQAYLAAKLAGRRDLMPGAAGLAAALDYLPLALSQAAAYLLDREITCTEYRQRLAARPLAEVLPEQSALPDNQRATAEQTWLLSVEHASSLAPAGVAGPVLELASQLDPAGVPEQVFTAPAAVNYLSSAVGRDVTPSDSRDALRCLQRLSLVSLYRADGGSRVRIHALVQKAARDRLPPQRRALVRLACADALVSAWPAAEGGTDLIQAFQASALALTERDGDDLLAPGVHPVLSRLGRSLGESGSFTAAAARLRQVHVAAGPHLGRDHQDVLRARLDEAYWLGEGGDEKRAVRLLHGVAGDCARVLGPEHRLTFEARLYSARYRGKESVRNGQDEGTQAAREDLVELAEEMTRVLGRCDEETMTARHDAAWSLGELRQFADALEEFGEVGRDRERELGREHHHTLITRNNIAHYTAKRGDNAGALRAYQEMLPVMIRVLGPVHQYTLATRANIAYHRGETGDREGAVQELRLVLAEMRRELGRRHPITVRTEPRLATQERHLPPAPA